MSSSDQPGVAAPLAESMSVMINSDDEEDAIAALEKLEGLVISPSVLSPVASPGTQVGRRVAKPAVVARPECIDDFIRNFLVTAGMTKTLESFESEWYQRVSTGEVSAPLTTQLVPDCYQQAAQLMEEVEQLRSDLSAAKAAAKKAGDAWAAARAARDHHRMLHSSVTQERNKLLIDLRRLLGHVDKYAPVVTELKNRYESACRDKAVLSLERDRLAAKLPAGDPGSSSPKDVHFATPTTAVTNRATQKKDTTKKESTKVVAWPPPHSPPLPPSTASEQCSAATRAGVRLSCAAGHAARVSSIAMHPTKPVIVTASEDGTWCAWSARGAEKVLTAKGHDGWIAGLDVSPIAAQSGGTVVATCGADRTVRLWDLSSKVGQLLKMQDHTAVVWSVKFHGSGDYVASGSDDCSARIWDLVTGSTVQRYTGPGAVNSLAWMPGTSILLVANSDGTVAHWDPRAGSPTITFGGFRGPVRAVDAAVDSHGAPLVFAADSSGLVKMWDTRLTDTPLLNTSLPQGNATCLSACPGGGGVAVGTNSGISLFLRGDGWRTDGDNSAPAGVLGADSSIESLRWVPTGNSILSGQVDGSWRSWGW